MFSIVLQWVGTDGAAAEAFFLHNNGYFSDDHNDVLLARIKLAHAQLERGLHRDAEVSVLYTTCMAYWHYLLTICGAVTDFACRVRSLTLNIENLPPSA